MAKKIAGILPGQFRRAGPSALSLRSFALWYRRQEAAQWEALDLAALERLTGILLEAQRRGRHVFVMGNGGSAATAASIAVDFSKTAAPRGGKAWKCISLAENAAFITAMSNDHTFDDIFVKQLEILLQPGDVVLVVSGSGNSVNLIKAVRYARSRKAKTAALLGFDGGRLKRLVDAPLVVASGQYGVVEDLHLAISHIITFFLRQRGK
ncbi:MAG: SIS domain-containing protein [Elusimicrobia bacterium]|nr:SIS domain-containing protein [Elusimicrobiota bacterium]